MNNLWTIIKKELRRFFTDRRMLVSLLLPGVMIYLLYTVMGDVMQNNLGQSEDQVYLVKIDNEPSEFSSIVGELYSLEYLADLSAVDAIEMIEAKELDLYLVFPADFIANYQAGNPTNITAYYNSTSPTSSAIWGTYRSVISEYLHANQALTISPQDQASEQDASMMIVTRVIPFLLITFLFSGAIAVAPESIAGEKERGTIANLLITPVKRSHIALGKIIALSITALASAASSFLGLMLSLPKLAGGNANFDFSMYNVGTYIMLLLVIVSTVLIFIVLISLISTYAKSIKEATGLSMPLMIIVMLVGVSTLMGSASTNAILCLIPVYNSVNSLLSIFSLEVNMLNLSLTIASNLFVTGLGILLLTLMFNQEKIMFRK